MDARTFVLALCIGGVALVGCNQSTTSPPAQLSKPSVNDVQLLAPYLGYIPCERCVGIAWQLDQSVPSASVTLDVSYYNVTNHESAHRPGSRASNHIEGETWELLSTHRLGTELPGNGTCPWQVPAIECDQAVLCFTVTGALTGNRTLVRNFLVGEVRVPNQHRPPQERITP